MKKIVMFLILIIYIFISILAEPISAINTDKDIVKNNYIELPKLYFEGPVDELTTKKEERTISVKYESLDINFNSYASIKLQGSSSLNYEKKNYNIKFYKDPELTEKLNVNLGWGEENKYCLKANWIDKTHARNIVTAKLTSSIQKKYNLLTNTPNYGEIDGFPIEIYLNKEFLGLYTLNIPKDDWMFNMDPDNENHLVFSGAGWNPTNFFQEEANFSDWEIEVGEENDESLIKLNRLFNFIINSSDEEFKSKINEYLNLDSVLNYYVMTQYAELYDNMSKNMLLVTYDGKIWYTTLYDLDTSWGTSWDGKETLDHTAYIGPGDNNLFKRIEKNFSNELADRYFELRNSILTEENVMSEFIKFTNSIPTEVYEKESARWNNIPGYDIQQINEFLKKRTPILDEKFSKMYTKCPNDLTVNDEINDKIFNSKSKKINNN